MTRTGLFGYDCASAVVAPVLIGATRATEAALAEHFDEDERAVIARAVALLSRLNDVE